ncbi:hypothetical protein MTP04_02760 [Lysinibacillus sp. PLM2]|nr:hypothetical protein MTP04_02760 [Lysinibacillus sp. PLM2]
MYLALSQSDKAFIIASIQVKVDAEKEADRKARQKANSGKHRKKQ